MTEWSWKHFTRDEMKCRHTGKCEISPDLMHKLVALRIAWGKPMIVTSGYRDASHPVEVAKGTAATSPHVQGIAVDIAVRGADAVALLKLALEHGFTGIGVQQKGEGRFLHLDVRKSPMIWSY